VETRDSWQSTMMKSMWHHSLLGAVGDSSRTIEELRIVFTGMRSYSSLSSMGSSL